MYLGPHCRHPPDGSWTGKDSDIREPTLKSVRRPVGTDVVDRDDLALPAKRFERSSFW